VTDLRCTVQTVQTLPRFGARPAPLDPFHLDPHTVRELTCVLAERLQQVETYGGTCKSCRDGEARAFLAKLRCILAEMDDYPHPMTPIAIA
jgi:hypothetical protein